MKKSPLRQEPSVQVYVLNNPCSANLYVLVVLRLKIEVHFSLLLSFEESPRRLEVKMPGSEDDDTGVPASGYHSLTWGFCGCECFGWVGRGGGVAWDLCFIVS